ncbi:NifU family protein [Butyricimonas sp.]|uniref:NifU family protein n=1 Tax=Butyricimonas sp. TaxID=1969738 RepID=UPI0025BBF278|nr:NifU family protein [Butyricimonas sp.]
MKTKTVNDKETTTLWKHLEEIIERHIRPLLRDHGGDIAIREIDGKDVRVALLGACKTCPAAQITIEQTVQRVLAEHLGDAIGNVILVNETDPDILDFARQILNRNKPL